MILKLPIRYLAAALLALGVLAAGAPVHAQVPAEQSAVPLPPQAQPVPPPYAGQPAAPQQYPQPYVQPAPVYAPPPSYPYPPPPPQRPSKGMMVTGISIFGGSYLFAAVVGTVVIDEDNCIDCSDIGPYLFIPVLGPFLAMPESHGGDGVLALLGVVETVGLGLMIGGIVRFKNTKRRAEERGYYTWQLPRERSLSLDVSTSPVRLGPQLSLKF